MVEENSETTGKDNLDEEVTVPPKIKPIMLRYKDNYNMVLQALSRKYPKSTNKLTGQYIRIIASTMDEHREITTLLKSKGEKFYSVPPVADRPLKVVIKGLPKSTPTEEIKADLLEQSFLVMKVSQLTQRNSKFPLLIFLVEVRKHVEGATDIYEVSKCCYMSGECPIKELLDTPHCINCNAYGYTANWRSFPAFPKIKNKKGTATENRIKNSPKTFTSKMANTNLSYANATSNRQQMTAPIEQNEPANNNSKLDSNKKEENTSPQGFISAMAEFRKFFHDFPGIIDAGKAFKNVKTSEDRLDIFCEGKKLNSP
ncbi:nucleic-acid-binding protein from transposon X-element [Trichonephila clavipes]|uniref:Nucleic-acid-binding protein from transposon X-element n=1 Tax=Trichonephila clavipes TaxID=2585209 RepID=A0A8X6VPU5_TRICX|nr:nucleic-acid-binding protein from transposon X-element [Trichonephila clavipes]